MFQKERTDKILSILKERGYVTVRALTEELRYSTATINRDLNLLTQRGEIRRSYGGVELAEPQELPVRYRYEQCKPIKKRIARRAAALVEDGDTLFMDGSTTVQYMEEYLAEKKNLTVLTNNTALSSHLAEMGIRVIVLGGEILEPPYMLGGNDTVATAARYKADKCFFSTAFVSREGEMSYTGDIYYAMHRTMMNHSNLVCYLVDGEKVDRPGARVILGDFSPVDRVVSDFCFPEETKERFPTTVFDCVD